MKTTISNLHNAGSKGEEKSKKAVTGKFFKFILVSIALSCITIMSSNAATVSATGSLDHHHGGYGHVFFSPGCFFPCCFGFGCWGYHRYHGGHDYYGDHGGYGYHGDHH
jgi:hypothetical protein